MLQDAARRREGNETRPRGRKYLTPPCALAKILPEMTLRAQFRQIENASSTTNTFLTFSTNNLCPCMYIHPGTPRVPPRVLASAPKSCGGNQLVYFAKCAYYLARGANDFDLVNSTLGIQCTSYTHMKVDLKAINLITASQH